MSQSVTVYTAIAQQLRSDGVEAVFGLMGEETAKLTLALDAEGIRYYTTRHEATAVGMADGFSRASGKVGVALVSRGPGLTNALTTIVSASKSPSRVLVLVGEGDVGVHSTAAAAAAKLHAKYIDQPSMLSACGVVSVTLDNPDTAKDDVHAALTFAGRGKTIVVNMPNDVQESGAGTASSSLDLPELAYDESTPDDEVLDEIADLLEASLDTSRIVILAGRGAVAPGAREALERLADSTGAIVASTLMAKGYFAGHPYDVGLCGGFSTEPAINLLRRADLVLVFGASLNVYTTSRMEIFPKARFIHFDKDPTAFGKSTPVDLEVLGDAAAAARVLAEKVTKRGLHAVGYRTDATRKMLDDFRLEDSFKDRSEPGGVDPRSLMAAIENVLPTERALVVDNGHHWTFSTTYLSVPDPAAYMSPNGYHCVGAATGIALGAAVARPDRLTVYCVGDGGMLMTLSDLETAVRYDLPMLVLVVNDEAFGSEVHFLAINALPDALARQESPSFEAIGRGMGFQALTIDSVDAVASLGEVIGAAKLPIIADCKVTSNVRAEWIDFHFGKAPVEEPA